MIEHASGDQNKPTGFRSDYISESKRLAKRGRCLHFDAGNKCNKIIAAHSIQCRRQLALIAEGGHVYQLTADPSVMRNANGVPCLKKIGIKIVSTFSGFCKAHDNSLFQSIDNELLMPNEYQAALYAYRSICRELFVKENAVLTLDKFRSDRRLERHKRSILQASYDGNSMGLRWLQHHKKIYDEAFFNKSFEDFRYVCFTSSSPCPLVLSGLLYPDFDFHGGFLQHLGVEQASLDLITFFTAPTRDGWAFCFAWHESSNQSCQSFITSLANKIASGEKLEDNLLRFSLTCCENHAIRISWWDSLTDKEKQELIHRMHMMILPDVPVPHDYLSKGCEGIAGWTFTHVFKSPDNKT